MDTNRDRKSFGSRRKIPNIAQMTGNLDVFDPRSGISEPISRIAFACLNIHEWWTQPAHVRSSCSAIDFVEIRRSSRISSWIWSINSGVVIVLGCPGQGASQVEKSPGLNWATLFLTVAYDGVCSPNVSFRMAWVSFGSLSCRGKKLNDSSRLYVVEILRVAWHASFQP